MSQLVGDIGFKIKNGITLAIVTEIVATLQPRPKVLYEITEKSTNRRLFVIHLDEQDYLSIALYNQDGKRFATPPVSPNKFAAYYINRAKPKECERAVLLTIRISPPEENAPGSSKTCVELLIDNKLAASVIAEGSFPDVEEAFASIGSARQHSDPATFAMGEFMIFNRSFDDDDLFSLNRYINSKWDVGEEVARLDTILSQLRKRTTILLVEDKYDQIYKLAWLKLNQITFEKERLGEAFSSNSHFTILGAHGAGAVAGVLRAQNPDLYKDHKLVGLFDFDAEGIENSYLLKREKSIWNSNVLGDKKTGYYKKRLDHPCFHAMLLPIPTRLDHLASLDHKNFANYVEIENLLPEEFLRDGSYAIEEKIPCATYLKIKERSKSKLWEKAFLLESKDFRDFKPIFDTFDKLVSA